MDGFEPTPNPEGEPKGKGGVEIHLFRHFSKTETGGLDPTKSVDEVRAAVEKLTSGIKSGDMVVFLGSGPQQRHKESAVLLQTETKKILNEQHKVVDIYYPLESGFRRRSLDEVTARGLGSLPEDEAVSQWLAGLPPFEDAVNVETADESRNRVLRLVTGVNQVVGGKQNGETVHLVAASSGLTLLSLTHNELGSDPSYGLLPGEELKIYPEGINFLVEHPNGERILVDTSHKESPKAFDYKEVRERSAEFVAKIISKLYPGKVMEYEDLSTGVLSAVYGIKNPNRPEVLKLVSDRERLRNEVSTLRKWQKKGVRCPEVYLVSDLGEPGIPPWFTMQKIETYKSRDEIDPSKREQLPEDIEGYKFQILGEELRKAHEVKVTGFGKLDARCNGMSLNLENAIFGENKSLRYLEENHLVDDLLTPEVRVWVENQKQLLTEIVTPSLLHGDPNTNNLIFDRDLKGYLIDPNPRAGDPLEDVAYGLIRAVQISPQAELKFLAAYFSDRERDVNGMPILSESEKKRLELFKVVYAFVDYANNHVVSPESESTMKAKAYVNKIVREVITGKQQSGSGEAT